MEYWRVDMKVNLQIFNLCPGHPATVYIIFGSGLLNLLSAGPTIYGKKI
jgi:hypothetical protein